MIAKNIVARYSVPISPEINEKCFEYFHLLDDGKVVSYRGIYDAFFPIDEWRSLEDFKAECQSLGVKPTLVMERADSGWPSN